MVNWISAWPSSAAVPRAPYASDPGKSRGRLHPEPISPTRNAFRRDCDRIIHSTAFRRLAYKTQVFVFHEGDHFRTRLTHTLEVTQIARSLARALGLDEDLAKRWRWRMTSVIRHLAMPASARSIAASPACGGFDHNAQSLRVVTALERRYTDFDGLNLSWETLEGLVKHNGPLMLRDGAPPGATASAASRRRSSIRQRQDLEALELRQCRGADCSHCRRHRL